MTGRLLVFVASFVAEDVGPVDESVTVRWWTDASVRR